MPKVIDQEQVFRAAIEILVTHGYENATTKKIAAASSMHEATLFRKFGSKLSLIEKAIEELLSDTPLNKVVYTGDLEADLLSILQAYDEVSEVHGAIIPMLLFEIARDPALNKLLQTPWKNIQLILDIIEKYQSQKQLKREPLLTTLNVLIGPIMVAHMFERAKTELPSPNIDLQSYVTFFLHGRRLQ